MELKSGTASMYMIGLHYPFISYSYKRDVIFCLACMLFPVDPQNGQRASLVIPTPSKLERCKE